jgi:hypothetical protein
MNSHKTRTIKAQVMGLGLTEINPIFDLILLFKKNLKRGYFKEKKGFFH